MDTTNNNQHSRAVRLDYLDWLINQKFSDMKGDITPDLREELRKDLIVQIDNFMMARVLAILSDAEVKEFEMLLKSGKTREDMHKYAAEHVPDFNDIVSESLVEFQLIYLKRK